VSTNEQSSDVDSNALKALGLALVGLVLGLFAFRLQLRGGDEKLFTYSLGLACSGFYMSSFSRLAKALRARSTSQPGAPPAGRVFMTAFTMTLVGVAIFTLSSVLANYMSTLGNLSGLEIGLGLIAALVPFLGPFFLGILYFYWMQQSLCESGWNVGAALIAAALSASVSTFSWYVLNIQFGPKIYLLIMS